MSMGVGALGQGALTAANAATQAMSSTGAFDPASTQAIYEPFQQQVIDEYTKEMQRQFNIQQAGRDAKAVGAGAFGGSRQGVLDAEAATGFQRQLGQVLLDYYQAVSNKRKERHNKLLKINKEEDKEAAQNLANIGRDTNWHRSSIWAV